MAAILVTWPGLFEQTFLRLNIKSVFDWSSGFWEDVWRVWTTDRWTGTDEGWMDNRACLYYKLTHRWAKEKQLRRMWCHACQSKSQGHNRLTWSEEFVYQKNKHCCLYGLSFQVWCLHRSWWMYRQTIPWKVGLRSSWSRHNKNLWFTQTSNQSNEPCHEKTCLRGFATRIDSNRSAHLQRLSRLYLETILKFRI